MNEKMICVSPETMHKLRVNARKVAVNVSNLLDMKDDLLKIENEIVQILLHEISIVDSVDYDLKCCGNCDFYEVIPDYGILCTDRGETWPCDRDGYCDRWKFMNEK